MKLIQLLFHQQVWLTILCLLTISPPALADPLTSDDYVIETAVLSDNGGEVNSTENSLTATVSTLFTEISVNDIKPTLTVTKEGNGTVTSTFYGLEWWNVQWYGHLSSNAE